ncbi:short-chain dehydrogenase [Microtetraspora sp. NBRC 13810]|uniref:SDR family NAD(P)-dependent oxidoreductase n=1 Tax=Microtetraspora sp. NBRC 13810 TaxID=3030990 RepID=UPI0024A21E14|nr:SDR family NAD(P)-dependent oxidoreductase [Microtetraspora sp. NBRC 13810]GLW11284.1 short-chain dehydrogenase [Microtetraspora sp. NBRC 13810]
MPTIAIVGAGPLLGLSVARLFGREGFRVVLIARSRANLDRLVAELAAEDVRAEGFTGDVTDESSMRRAFDQAGPVDVLHFSPVSKTLNIGSGVVGALDVSPENVQRQLDVQLHGAITSVQQVLPGMLGRGTGTLLFTTAYAAVQPMDAVANFGIAGAALRYYAATLHSALAGKGVHVAHVSVAAYLNTGPGTEPDTVARVYWDAYTRRDQAEITYFAPES